MDHLHARNQRIIDAVVERAEALYATVGLDVRRFAQLDDWLVDYLAPVSAQASPGGTGAASPADRPAATASGEGSPASPA